VPVRSDDLRSKITATFATAGRKRSRSASAQGQGGTISASRAVPVRNQPGAQSGAVPRRAPGGLQRESAAARDAQLVIARIEPWSVMKFSFVLSLVAWVVLFVFVAVIYFALSALGVFHAIEQTIGIVTSTKGHPGSNAANWFSASTVLGYTLAAGVVDIFLITAVATVGAVIYNAVTRLAGGIEVTLRETDLPGSRLRSGGRSAVL